MSSLNQIKMDWISSLKKIFVKIKTNCKRNALKKKLKR